MSESSISKHLRKEAKSLLKLCRGGDSSALARVRAQLPRVTSEQIKLADVHHALAKEHGYLNWAELKQQDAPLSRFSGCGFETDRFRKPLLNCRKIPIFLSKVFTQLALSAMSMQWPIISIWIPNSSPPKTAAGPRFLYALCVTLSQIECTACGGNPLVCGIAAGSRSGPEHIHSGRSIRSCKQDLRCHSREPYGNNGSVYQMLIERGAAPDDPRANAQSMRDKRRRLFPRLQLDEVLTRMSDEDLNLEMNSGAEWPHSFIRWMEDPSRRNHGLWIPKLRKAAMSIASGLSRRGLVLT